jgi:FAD/FMN-containing dehydrogenase
VAGYTVGGRMSRLGRSYGLSANKAAAFEVVTTHGRTAGAYERLRRIKAVVDPNDVIRSHHPIPPAA